MAQCAAKLKGQVDCEMQQWVRAIVHPYAPSRHASLLLAMLQVIAIPLCSPGSGVDCLPKTFEVRSCVAAI